MTNGSRKLLDRALDAKQPRFDIINHREIAGYRQERLPGHNEEWSGNLAAAVANMPTPRWRSSKKVMPDLFTHLGIDYASKRLLSAMALAPGVLATRVVDCADCDPETRAAGYHAIFPLVFGSPVDPAQSEGSFQTKIMPDGTKADVPVIDWDNVDTSAPARVLKDHFVGPAAMFGWDSKLVATDDLADRVLNADLDVQFIALDARKGPDDDFPPTIVKRRR